VKQVFVTGVLTVLLPVVLFAGQQSRSDAERACDSAQAQAELNQCFGEQFKKADAHLNIVYRKILAFMQDNLSDAQRRAATDEMKNYEAAVDKLKAAEKAWIQYRDLHCDAARHEVWGGSMAPMVWAQYMEQVIQDRTEELKRAYGNGELKLE